jgi:hypothetical protein
MVKYVRDTMHGFWEGNHVFDVPWRKMLRLRRNAFGFTI